MSEEFIIPDGVVEIKFGKYYLNNAPVGIEIPRFETGK